MKVTLRKANALQAELNNTLRALEVETAVSVSEFQDPETVIAEAHTKMQVTLSRRLALVKAIYDIRGLVGTANSASGIDAKLTQVAFIQKQLELLLPLSIRPLRVESAVLAGRLDKVRNRKEDTRYSLMGSEDVSTPILTQTDVDAFVSGIKTLKKQKQALQDEVLELNVRTEIELTADTEATLRNEGLV